ncbi:hypothetical protein M430DRAFT_46100 [Amorphotheca resinae ATCC 22711]|uniref:NmrA-like domain-containing protein n=1 Tax=Amorphotheca resinae ATCC 22711 TaxID=857342 RepID=A0A2T3APA6_AMORE|nr:hypothetical protein M430DRAFT_46100 [Amorphotheca resinae ATCC 22711]PSS06762.1 hypothetical protein M430DRAFT_46100 [Amorphotheca resinae ATCC 22711]
MRRPILITGSTGKQGRALIRALLHGLPPIMPSAEDEYRIYALTRSSSSAAAKALRESENEERLQIVEGDLDDRESIVRIFERVSGEEGGFWGVYCVLEFPGLGADATGEERRGKLLADLALKYKVQAYIYSSAMRSGPEHEDTLILSGRAKANVENYCMVLGEKGLPWTILRPGFFMENFDDFLGSIAVGVLKSGLKKETTIGIVASEDIGYVAAGVFRHHEMYRQKILTLVSEFATMTQLEDSYQRALGKPLPSVPAAVAWPIMKMNKMIRWLINDLEKSHRARVEGEYPQLENEVSLANEVFEIRMMRTYYDWLRTRKRQRRMERLGESRSRKAKWNQLSLGKLLTGRA